MDASKTFRIIYFTGTGNTEYLVTVIQKYLTEKGCACDTLAADSLWRDCGRMPGIHGDSNRVADKLQQFISAPSFLIIAFPTYGSDIPKPLKEIIPLFPAGKGIKLISLVTGGDCCLLPFRMFKSKEYEPYLSMEIRMPNNVPFLFKIKNGDELKHFYNSVGKKVNEIIDALVTGKKIIKGRGIINAIIGLIQRSGEACIMRFMNKNLFMTVQCARCKLCASTCPMGNITFQKGYPEFNGGCCACLRCFHFCPVSAIQIGQKTMDILKYKRFKGFNNWKPPQLYKI